MAPGDMLADLTPPQHEAVTHMDGPMLVVAGAGSGKTRVVTRRIAYLISKGIWPNQILAMTFTNKAANEMKERVAELVGVAPRWVGTFHSACARFLRRDMPHLHDGRTSDYTIYDTTDQRGIVRLCLKDLNLINTGLDAAEVLTRISRAKCAMVSPADMDADPRTSDPVARVYAAYEERLRQLNAVDFDDLLLLVVKLLESRPDIREVYHSRFRYLLVDEYQDTNHIQYRLMHLLAGPSENVHATGDPDQSIYSWRGADYRNIMAFTDDYPNAKVVRLEQNYRSTKKILHAANELIRQNANRIDKELFTDNPDGVEVTLVACGQDRQEAAWVVNRMAELKRDGIDLRDMAVFYRTNAQSRPFEEALIQATIPYQIVGGIRFYERKEIKDVLAHLQLLVNPRDVISLERVTNCRPTGVGAKSINALVQQSSRAGETIMDFLAHPDFERRYQGRKNAKLVAFAAWCRTLRSLPRSPVGDAVYEVIEHSGLIEHFRRNRGKDPAAEDRIGNLNALVDRAYEFQQLRPDSDLSEFLEEVALISDVDNHDRSADCVSLMTLHSSKGLEFPFVFVVGVEEGYLPHANALELNDGEEEERRLFYVGLTRAQEEVVVSYALSRYMWREIELRRPSRFLAELPAKGTRRVDLTASRKTWSSWYDAD